MSKVTENKGGSIETKKEASYNERKSNRRLASDSEERDTLLKSSVKKVPSDNKEKKISTKGSTRKLGDRNIGKMDDFNISIKGSEIKKSDSNNKSRVTKKIDNSKKEDISKKKSSIPSSSKRNNTGKPTTSRSSKLSSTYNEEDDDEIVEYEIIDDTIIDDENLEEEFIDDDVQNIVIQSKETDESKYDTISLKEIRETLEKKMDTKQKKSTVKEALINIGMAIIMVVYLIVIIMGSKNIDIETLEKDMKIMALGILAIGVFILELSYKKENTRMSINGIEVIVFGAVNLCLVYTVKLYISSLVSLISYISIGIGGYYLVKAIILSKINIRKFKKDNNDIREIIKK